MGLFDEISNTSILDRIARNFSQILPGNTNIGIGSSYSDIVSGTQSTFRSQALDAGLIDSIYGSDFAARYRSFEQDYFRALSDSSNLRKNVKFNVQSMMAEGRIDLSLFNYTQRQAMESRYLNEVLDLQRLFNEAGLPSVQLPSANPFRKSFRYVLDQQQIGGAAAAGKDVNIAAILLNRLTFNIDPRQQGMQGVSVGVSNIASLSELQRTASQMPKVLGGADFLRGRRVGIFDVETTGVFSGAQVRSMAITEMAGGLVRPGAVTQYAYESPQLTGLMVSRLNEGVMSFNEYIGEVEGTSRKLRAMGAGGGQFLDDATQYINQLLSYDTISAHNAMFDLKMISRTMQQMPGFGKHTEAKAALKTLFERISKEPDFLVDTLELSRSYMLDLVNQAGTIDDTMTMARRSASYSSRLYAPEVLGRAHTGGGLGFATVENIALNTNLTELIMRDSPNLLQGAAHQAAYDTALQSQILKYISNNQLQLRSQQNISSLGISDDLLGEAAKVRMQIFRASAITPTTNLVDPNYVSRTTFNYLQSAEGMRGVTLNLSQDQVRSLFSGVDIRGAEQALLSYGQVGDQSGFVLRSLQGLDIESQLISNTQAQNAVRSILNQSVSGSTSALNSIVSLGINQYAESAAMEMAALRQGAKTISSAISDQTVFDALTSVYTDFGRRTPEGFLGNLYRPPDVSGGFIGGIRDYGLEESQKLAETMRRVGSPYDFMDVRSRIFSTAVSEATSELAQNIYSSAMSAGSKVDELLFMNYAKELSSQGISYWNAQSKARIIGATAEDTARMSKILLPTDIAEEALRAMPASNKVMSSLSMSVNSDETVNLVWNIGRQFSKDESDTLAYSILEVLDSRYQNARINSQAMAEMDRGVVSAMQSASSLLSTGDREAVMRNELFQSFSELLRERGAVVGRASDRVSQNIIQSLRGLNIPIGGQESDVVLGSWTARSLRSVGDQFSDLILSPFMQEEASRIAGVSDQARQADSLARNSLNEISEHLRSSSDLRTRVGRAIDVAGGPEDTSSLARMYRSLRGNFKAGALGLSAAIVGYYASSKYEERNLINETIEQQPYETRTYNNPRLEQFQSGNRIDPLLTAGVVGSMDRSKIGHHMMGPNKNNHLFGY